ncbi:MAG TPA: zinc ribbon domain-containing protein [Methanofastidiosum sp.]|nr:zinc ribbon domain-containing protein [Methanofastidiosum sp.]HQK63460.1 zinc ribbon domain-containing protein [Methanofastidiosum sp.]HQM94656.1 zinc ribbon domain-containing protein [Methanofastidiosum sp.]HQQ48655.1 zinc ribbon domain-containing protein [Methanofastidiosum sp.]
MEKDYKDYIISVISKILYFKKVINKIFVIFLIILLFLVPIGGVLGEDYAVLFDANSDCVCKELNSLGIQLTKHTSGIYTTNIWGAADRHSGLRCTYTKDSGTGRDTAFEMEIKCYKNSSEASNSIKRLKELWSNESWTPIVLPTYEINGHRPVIIRDERSSTRMSYIQKVPVLKSDDSLDFSYAGMTVFVYRDIFIVSISYGGYSDSTAKAVDALEKYAKDLIDQKIAGMSPENHPPEVKITYSPKNPTVNDTIIFSVDASDPDGDKLSYEWYRGFSLNSKSKPNSKSSTFELNKPVQGIYSISVKTKDGKGGEAWDQVEVHVSYYKADPSDKNIYLDAVYGEITVNGKKLNKGEILKLKEGDIIETSSSDSGSGYAALKFAQDGARASIRPGTRLKYDGRNILMWRGDIYLPYTSQKWYYTTTEGYNLGIRTGHACTGVYGTEYEVAVKEDGTSSFTVFDGTVKVSDVKNRKTVTVNAGQKATVPPNGVPSNPVSFDVNTYDRWWEDEPFYTSSTMLSGLSTILPIAIVLIVVGILLLVALPRVKKANVMKIHSLKTPSIKVSSVKSQNRCPNCGVPLHNAKIFCNSCGAKIKNIHTFCTYCGKEAKPGGVYCESCGRKL